MHEEPSTEVCNLKGKGKLTRIEKINHKIATSIELIAAFTFSFNYDFDNVALPSILWEHLIEYA